MFEPEATPTDSQAPNDAASWRERLRNYWVLVRADRPIGIYLLLWPVLWALWIAGEGRPTWWIVLIFVLGTILMRSAGCAINDFADRHFDPRVRRTRERPLATGVVSPAEALGVFATLSLLAFGLVLFLNAKTIAHSFVAVGLAALYPFTKRFTHWPQLFLGLAFGWAVPMAFTALRGEVPMVGWLLFAATVVWALVYDTMYAMVNRDDDLQIGVKSTAVLFGNHDKAIVGLLQVAVVGLLMGVGWVAERGPVYFSGLIFAAGLFLYQQQLVKARVPADCFQAFRNNHYLGMVVFGALVADYLTRGP
jgi:4-hydroxybenzoate polyprenyltransferase